MNSRIKVEGKKRKKVVPIIEMEYLQEELKQQEEFTKYLQLKGYSSSTAERYKKDVEKFKEWAKEKGIRVEQVSYSEVLHYIQGKRNQVKQKTISTNINSIKHYFNFLALTDQAIENPTTQIQIKGIKRRTLYHILSKPELESLYKNFEIPDEESKYRNQNWFKTSVLASKRNKVILGLMVYQGLGSGELGALKEKDIKLREGKICIAGTRKSNERELKLEAHQVLDMMEYTLQVRNQLMKLKKNNTDNDSLFVSVGNSEHFRSIINKLIKKLNKQSRKITSVKQIRASVITHWLKQYDLREVQYKAGHRYVSSTEAYLVNDIEDLQTDIDQFHPI